MEATPRKVQQKTTAGRKAGKGAKAVQETTARAVTRGAYVNPIRSKTEQDRPAARRRILWIRTVRVGRLSLPATAGLDR